MQEQRRLSITSIIKEIPEVFSLLRNKELVGSLSSERQTLLESMPENLTPAEQVLWFSKEILVYKHSDWGLHGKKYGETHTITLNINLMKECL